MDRKKRESTKARYEALRRSRSDHNARRATERDQRAVGLRRAFAACEERALREVTFVPADVRQLLAARAPRLLDARFADALIRLMRIPGLRLVDDWEPRGKAADTLFRSLASHRLARFPMPSIVWNAFFEDAPNHEPLVALATHVAAGGSMFAYANDAKTAFPIPLTRRMCHDVLATPSDVSFLSAIRRAQVRAAGGDRRFFEAWRVLAPATRIGSKPEEDFWFTVVQWFAKAGMIDHAQIGPIVDYVGHRRRDDPSFSMKGRTAPALLRATREWHGDLAKAEAVASKFFLRSGFSAACYDDSRRDPDGSHVKEKWEIREVLDAKTLADEGRRMGHCVYSYAWRIEKREVSIWSVQMEDGKGETGRWHMVTVEVRNDLKRVVQARGRFNRQMTPKELRILTRWAYANGLTMSLGAW